MAYNIHRAGRLVAIALAAYLAAGCSATTEDRNPPKSALASVETPSPERLAGVQLRVGRAAFDQGSLGTALELFEKAHKSAPDSAAPLIGKGDTLFAQRNFDAAEVAYRAALAREPGSFEAHEGLGKTLVTLKKFQDGLRALEAARAIRTDAGLINKIGVTYELQGHGEAAQKHYREALALDAESLTARNNLALSLAVSGTYEAAVREMERVVASPRASERHHANLAFIYGLAGRPMGQAPAGVMRAAINKGWDEEFFARTRRLAETGDRGAILDLLNNGAARGANLPEMPAMPEMPEMPEDIADQPGAAPVADIPPPPPAPMAPEIAVETPAAPEPVMAAILPVSLETADLAASAADQPTINTVISPELVADPEQTGEPVPDAAPPPPAPADMAEPATPMTQPEPQISMTEAAPVPAPPPAPADMAAPATPVTQPEPQIAMTEAMPVPAPPAAPRADAATPGGIYRLQVGAYPSRWLGRALQGLAKSAGDLLPANHIEVVRSAQFHTLRSAGIADLAYARQLCKTLRARNVGCFVTRQASPPTGQGFDIATTDDRDALALFIASIEPIAPVAAKAPESTVAMPRTAGPADATPAGSGKYRIQFAAYRRVEHLGRGLKVLRDKAGDLLPAIEALVRSESAEKTKVPYRLRSAPMDNRAAAVTLCNSLAEKGVECLVIRHGDQSWRALG